MSYFKKSLKNPFFTVKGVIFPSPFIAEANQSCFQITKSLNSLNCYDLNVFMKLFDLKVYCVLSYACELWGMKDMPEIEKMHTMSFKLFLNVSVHCSNVTLYAEIGRYPLSINHKSCCLRYWIRLFNHLLENGLEMTHLDF